MDDPTPAATPTRRPRRWWHRTLSLRALMLIVLVGGGLLGWKARRISIQRRAVATIRAAGGSVWYEHQGGPDDGIRPPRNPPAPRWLRRLVGDEPFQEVAGVHLQSHWDRADDALIEAYLSLDRARSLSLGSTQITVEQAGRIAEATHLRSFHCANGVISDEGFKRLCRRADLDELTIEIHAPRASYSFDFRSPTGQQRHRTFRGSDFVTADAVAAIRSLVQLTRLNVQDDISPTFLSPAGTNYLPHLAALTQLRSLEIWGRMFADDDILTLAPLHRLETLAINGSRVTDSGLAVAAGWPDLKSLSFWPPQFADHRGWGKFQVSPARLTDAGLSRLAGCLRLEKLVLIGDRFADPGMAVLAGLPVLRKLELDGFDATPAGLGQLLAGHQFEKLTLMGPGVGDAIVPSLIGQQALKELSLINPGLTDAVVPILIRLPALETVDLRGSKLTDAGVAALAATSAPIKTVDLRGSNVTTAAVAAFRATHPKIQVLYGPN